MRLRVVPCVSMDAFIAAVTSKPTLSEVLQECKIVPTDDATEVAIKITDTERRAPAHRKKKMSAPEPISKMC